MKNYTKIFFILILTSCTYGPTGYNYWYVPTMEKNARQKGNSFHVVAFSPFKDTPWMGSSSLNYDEAESIAMRRCRANANDCYVYLKKYLLPHEIYSFLGNLSKACHRKHQVLLFQMRQFHPFIVINCVYLNIFKYPRKQFHVVDFLVMVF